MKTAILLANGVKQIMFTPENDTEREALSHITSEDNIHTVIAHADFYRGKSESSVFGVDVCEYKDGVHRAEKSEESVMFVLTPKSK